MRRWALPLIVCAVACADTKIPPIWPQVQGIFPRGGERGTEVRVAIKGRNLQDAKSVVFRSPKITGAVVNSDAYSATLAIRMTADAEPGRHDFRLVCAHGSALGYFDVGTYPERFEKEPNDSRAKAEALSFPALVNGNLKAADYDYFRFEAKAGETIVFDVKGTRIGANTDSVLSLLNEAGEEIAYSDDYYGFKDPHLRYKFGAGGTYFLRVYGSGEAGSDVADYRLVAGRMPHADMAMPGGATRGATVEFALRGVNLEGVDSVTLGDGLAKGEILSKSFGEARVRMKVPESAGLREYKLHVGGAMLPVPFVVSPYREVTVADGSARSRRDPKPVTLPVVANGVIDKPKAVDHFIFRVDEPKTIVLDVQGMQLDYLIDPLVLVYDESGKRIAYQDEPTTNTGKEPANMDPHLVVRIDKPGRYIAAIRDAAFRGDPKFLYRLTIKDAEPDFSLRTIGTDETLYRGRANSLLVRVRRLEGWDQPVEVWAENLPPGVTAKRVTAEPKNTPYTGTCGETHYLDGTNVEMIFEVAGDAPANLAHVRIRGRGMQDGKTVERSAKARYFKSRIRHIGDAEEEELRATVADAPGVVLQVPQSLTLNKNRAEFTAIVTRLDERLDEAKRPIELSLEAVGEGLAMEPLEVAPGVTRADVKLSARDKAVGEFVLVARVGEQVLGKSHPVRVRIGK